MNHPSARDTEAALLARLGVVARSDGAQPQDEREANVCWLAGTILGLRHHREAARLVLAAEAYFRQWPQQRLAPAECVRRNWIISIPRLKVQLSAELGTLTLS